MSLVNMAIVEDDDEAMEANPYGYGLCIRLNPAQCEALGVGAPKAGTPLMINARTIASTVTQEADVGGDGEVEVYLELQITDMSIKQISGTNGANAKALYGGDND